jgi:LysR family transcriptional regulator, transcriptional activator of nhaA
MIPFNFHHLYYFYTVAKLGSVTKAAKELRVSQPALSSQIKALQDRLDVRLFEKQGRKLILTEEGHSALAYAKQIFDTGKEFADRLGDHSLKGRIKVQIGVLNSIPKILVNSLLKFIVKHEPEVLIQLQEDTSERMMSGLKDHLLDIIVADTPIQSSSEEEIEHHLIAKIPIVFCAHPSLAKKLKKLPRDLDHAPMIFPTADSRVYQSVQEYLATNKITPKIVAEIQDIELARLMAMEGLGIVPLNKLLAASTPSNKLVTLKSSSNNDLYESIYLIIKKRKITHPIVERIIRDFRLPR